MPDLHYSEADGHLYQCDGCDHMYLHREPGDMADLQNFCRRCAEEVAAQLEVDYNLPIGGSDEDRQLALNPPEDKETIVLRCETTSCLRWNMTWSTTLTPEEWRRKYGRRWYHCFRCGEPSTYIRVWWPTNA